MGAQLEGKVAIVTGGAAGLGRGIAERFVEEGAQVVVADVDAGRGEALAAALGGSAAFTRTDVADAEQVQALVDFTVGRFGGLHVFVNNAGIGEAVGAFLKDDLSGFERSIGVNLFGVMVGAQRAARYMKDHGGGSIVNISSIGGISAGAGVMTYRVAKAAVVHFTRCSAIEWAPYGIRSNCIAPGHIITDITHYDMDTVVRFTQPLQRRGTVADVANAAVFLGGDQSAQITGLVMPVDGGTTLGPPVTLLREVTQR